MNKSNTNAVVSMDTAFFIVHSYGIDIHDCGILLVLKIYNLMCIGENKMIVYKSTNLINGKVYIGITTRSFEQRKKEHVNDAFNNDSPCIFHRALRKYGEENFTWEIIDNAEAQDELNEKEKYWINYYNSYMYVGNSNGYNMTFGGDGISGFKYTEEQKKKLSETLKLNGSKRGSKSGKTNLTEDVVLEIKDLLKNGNMTQKEIAKRFKVSIDIISKIKIGKSWSFVGEDVSDINYWNTKKLTEEEVLEIKKLIKLKIPYREIALKFNVARITIYQIKKGTTWSHVGEDVSKIKYSKSVSNSKLTENDVRKIKLLIKEKKMKLYEIATKFNVSASVIYNISSGLTWSHVVI